MLTTPLKCFQSHFSLNNHRHLVTEIESPEENPTQQELILYTSPKGHVKVELIYGHETFWLTQKRMSELFGVDVRTVNEHLKNIYTSEELEQRATIRKFRIVQLEGSRQVARAVDVYNLDAIIAVGYRVNSYEATQFRIWATSTLKEYIIKGFVMDDDRLKQGSSFGKDYFNELLERIRDIRASERRFYQKITDVYATSIDYDSKSPVTRQFFQVVQNKLEWAITSKTAAELIQARADAKQPNMGLTTWKNGPSGRILKSDVAIAKNYLSEEELKSLNRIVTMYLDYAESQAERKIVMKMTDWIDKLDAFLKFNDYEILTNAGKISMEVATKLAEAQYEKFRPIQDAIYESDFDRAVKKLNTKSPK